MRDSHNRSSGIYLRGGVQPVYCSASCSVRSYAASCIPGGEANQGKYTPLRTMELHLNFF